MSGSPSARGSEQLGVEPLAPQRDVEEAVALQLLAHGRRGDHQPARRAVEPAHVGVAGGQRHRQPGRDVFREPRVVAGGERQLPFQADPARGQADRALGGDVDGFGFEGLEPLLDLFVGAHRQLDLGVGGQGEGRELIGADHLDHFAHVAQFGDHAGERAHDAVDLGGPGVGSQQDAHVRRKRVPRSARSRATRVSAGPARSTLARPSPGFPAVRPNAPPGRCSFPPSRRRWRR